MKIYTYSFWHSKQKHSNKRSKLHSNITVTCIFVYFSKISKSTRRLYLGLLTVYKIIHGLVYYPPNIFTARIGRTPNTTRPYLYHCQFAHTNYYKHSFIPHTINTWNTLPLTVVDTSFSLFKSTIWDHIY